MSDIAIHIEHLGKQYNIGKTQARYRTFRDTLVNTIKSPFRKAARLMHGDVQSASDLNDTIWALKDVSFDVKQGEVVGIIGRNGAGKSTLLKILSRITEPTEGKARIFGRVGSLLEIGTGFHPELTGRENIYLNGAILGMKRAEIERKFDEIIEFAEIEKFLDTPVKHYSSGMYVRLAFAVAAHLETEILLIDEVLAVGDIEFQRKCLGKMGDVATDGRTVLFVSHNMDSIQRLCQRGLLLQEGHLVFNDTANLACQQYLKSFQINHGIEIPASVNRKGDGRARITKLEVIDIETGSVTNQLLSGKSFMVRFHFTAKETVLYPRFGFALLTSLGIRVFNSLPSDSGLEIEKISGSGTAEIVISDLTLSPGDYSCHLAISDRSGNYCDYLLDLPCFEVKASDLLSRSRSYDQSSGVIFANTEWKVRNESGIRI